jgi:isopentenyl diphosphate isomerase/L-lactate dehydrogenase-like FMN-dependent dehydrogenase
VAGSVTFDRNLEAWQRVELAPRVLAGVGVADPRTSVLGTDVSTPVLLAPAGLPRNAHSEGEVAAAKGADMVGTLMVLSHFAIRTVEEVAAAAPDCRRWFQLYLTKDRGNCEDLLARARAANYGAIVDCRLRRRHRAGRGPSRTRQGSPAHEERRRLRQVDHLR